ncbi:MAG TPA: endolytic transglycosylase MltG [Chloroflexota bacterium]|nr:endolytic transglycosylase MltG [Chloroflexota bacterium]
MNSRPVTTRRARPVLAHPYGGSTHRGIGLRLAGIAIVLLAILGVVGVGWLYWTIHQPASRDGSSVTFHVGTGDTVSTIADRLQTDGLIDSALLFRIDARLRDLGGNLKVGDYVLRRNMSIDQTITALTIYHANTISVTIPEGYRMEQVAALLNHHGISGAQFLRAAQHPGNLGISILQGKPAGASLEGYLFPNTYDVPPHYSGAAFARYMVQTLNSKFTPRMKARARAEGLTVYQVLTLASIVQREDKIFSEAPKIASVYLNRLHVGMKLQADPTVQYALGTPRDWWPVITQADYQIAAPYNTYVHTGLPPGPIANPGMVSIDAVLYPAQTKFLFFVASGHGHHVFAQTYAQQLQNEAKYSTPTP